MGAAVVHPLELREPTSVHGRAGTVSRMDANELALQLSDYELAYLDPPYNQHSYFSNYHIWETLMWWDASEFYGVACKRLDCKTTKSEYNSRPRSWAAFSSLIEQLPTPWILVSFKQQGLPRRRRCRCPAVREGIHALGRHRLQALRRRPDRGLQPPRRQGREVSHLRNKELLFMVGPDEDGVENAARELMPVDVTEPQTTPALF